MNTSILSRLLVVCAVSLAAMGAAEAKGSLSVGLTIVSSCAASSASVYSAVTSGNAAAMKSGCTNDAAYTVSMSSQLEAQMAPQGTSGREQANGDVVVTLTY